MSDRVFYMVGDTEGRDCQQWPTIVRSEINHAVGILTEDERDQIWPVDITIDQLMALAVRVKKWKLNGNIEVSKTVAGVGFGTASASAVLRETEIVVITEGAEATRESDLVRTVFNDPYHALVNEGTKPRPGANPISDWTETADFGIGEWSGSTPPTANVVDSLNLILFGGFVLFDPNTGLFAPRFEGIGNLVALQFGGAPLFAFANFNRHPQTISSGVTPIILRAQAVMTINPVVAPSFTVPMSIGWRFVGEAVGDPASGSGSGEFSLEAVEFWPYENSRHEPIWDTTDGEPIDSDPLAPFA